MSSSSADAKATPVVAPTTPPAAPTPTNPPAPNKRRARKPDNRTPAEINAAAQNFAESRWESAPKETTVNWCQCCGKTDAVTASDPTDKLNPVVMCKKCFVAIVGAGRAARYPAAQK